MIRNRARSAPFALTAALCAVVVLTGCGSASAAADPIASGKLGVAASTNAWGSVLAQLGGDRVVAVSIINSPDTDPHDYEPTPADARVIADARLFVQNGVGYDAWAARALGADPDSDRSVVTVGELAGVQADGNPHLWYSPHTVTATVDAITTALKKTDPADAGYFDTRRQQFDTVRLARYHALIAEIRSKYAGRPVGASESIFAPLSEALGLDLVTPPSFLKAISEGTDPSAADKAMVDAQIKGRTIEVYVFNSQNATPDIAEQVDAARAAGIPVVSITETLSPADVSFQDWQVAQLQQLKAALARATGR